MLPDQLSPYLQEFGPADKKTQRGEKEKWLESAVSEKRMLTLMSLACGYRSNTERISRPIKVENSEIVSQLCVVMKYWVMLFARKLLKVHDLTCLKVWRSLWTLFYKSFILSLFHSCMLQNSKNPHQKKRALCPVNAIMADFMKCNTRSCVSVNIAHRNIYWTEVVLFCQKFWFFCIFLIMLALLQL